MNSLLTEPLLLKIFLLVYYVVNSNGDALDNQNQTTNEGEIPMAADTPVQLIGLAMREEHIYGLVKDRVKNLKEQLNLLERYVLDYEDSSTKKMTEQPESTLWSRAHLVASHPILAFRMINRYTKNLWEIKNVLGAPDNLGKLKAALQVEGYTKPGFNIPWPSYQDISQAMDSILKIHHHYDLNVNQFTTGNVLGFETGVHLNAYDTTVIGMYALEWNYFDLAVEWLQEASRKILQNNDKSISLDVTNQMLRLAFKTHDDQWDRLPADYANLFAEKTANSHKSGIPLSKRRNALINNLNGQRFVNQTLTNFWALCAGDNLQTEAEKSELFCYQDPGSKGAYVIMPVKTEILSTDPLVYQFYDVIGNKLISKISKRVQLTPLERSRVVNNDTKRISSVRTYSQTFLIDQEIPELHEISRRISDITGLDDSNLDDWENLQVVSYTFGRFYTPHLDSPSTVGDNLDPSKVTRIATFLLYLNDVQMGGYTAFPCLGIFASPVKGSAIYWHNLYRNGRPDKRTWHGSCPVVLGIKWVANKWIGYPSQFKSRPCTLDPDE